MKQGFSVLTVNSGFMKIMLCMENCNDCGRKIKRETVATKANINMLV